MPKHRAHPDDALPLRLDEWDFGDARRNDTISLVNRQKSALNLTLLWVDERGRRAAFHDPKTQSEITASLSSCECKDFLFVGKVRRRHLQPCMHIFRLAMELGVLESRYLDHAAREVLRQRLVQQLTRREDSRLAQLGRDPEQWGGWPVEVHQSGLQRNRQYRAYFILDDELDAVAHNSDGWLVRGHRVTLDGCDCWDFIARRLPCKHVYTTALATGIPLPLLRTDYVAARRRGLGIVFEFDVRRPDPLDEP